MITVFGSINLDLIGAVERLPGPGETVPGRTFATAAGGKGANQALAAARAGAAVRMVGAVGRDGFAGPALSLLEAGGVDLARVRVEDAPTGVALILVDAVGENVIAVIPGANATVGEAAADSLEFKSGDLLLLQLEVPLAGMRIAAERARSAGAVVLLNFAPFLAHATELIRHATHLIVNESECALIADALGIARPSIEEQASTLAKAFDVAAIVTLGREGVVAAEAGRILRTPALAVNAVDTVGAGDTFCGYVAAALSDGQSLEKALAMAAFAASLACTRPGAQPSIPIRAEVVAALGSS